MVKVSQTIDNLSNNGTLPVSVGDKLFIFKTDADPDIPWEAGDFCRFDYILLLIGLFLLGILVFGRSKGVKTILSLAFTCLAVFVVFVPAILAGCNAYIAAMDIAMAIPTSLEWARDAAWYLEENGLFVAQGFQFS